MRTCYRTLKEIDAGGGIVLPVGSFCFEKFRSEEPDTNSAWYEFVGLFSGCTAVIKDKDLIRDGYV